MSLEYEELMIDKISRGGYDTRKNEEKELECIQQQKQQFVAKQQRDYIEELLKNNGSMPINLRNVQVLNSEKFRYRFLEAQLSPLLNKRLSTLSEFTKNLDATTSNLRKLNICENLIVNLVPISKRIVDFKNPSLDVVLIFNVIPIKRFYAKTGTSIGNGEGDGYIQFQLRNIFGGAENLTFDALTGTRTLSSYLLRYNQPVFNNANVIYENISYMNTNKMEWLQAECDMKGFSNKIYTQYDLPFNHEFIFENSWRRLRNLHSKSIDILHQLGENFKTSVLYNFKYDTRNKIFLPISGSYFRIGLEYSGFTAFNSTRYLKSAMEFQHARKINELHSLILSSKSGVLYPISLISHVLDRFYIGGPNDVRSFVLNGLGPKSVNSSLGGDLFFNGGLSLISKVPYLSAESNFRLHNFINLGKLIPLDKSLSVQGNIKSLFSQPSIGFGLGIIYDHPAARFELNFVLPLVVHEYDLTRKGLQYGIGISFL